MHLIVGLGNPGTRYERTRHNVGFMAVEAVASNFQFPIFNFQPISNSLISKSAIADQTIMLAKPQTFMNNSGQAVKKLLANNKQLITSNLVVVHDDIDLPLGTIKISVGSGAGGHKGVTSIIQAVGTHDFVRLRVGIQPEEGKPNNVENFVLQEFSTKEQAIVKQSISTACNALDSMLQNGVEKAMNEYN